ncbi:peroxiredoxin [Lysobacter arvi]|uniref:Peroxiredoxin n=1 Tax=Lysobacter arvi TaxID=3038776 RepID=A0ABU1C9Z5_9GAMM|nr:peroxiredoxin [Lysobacter arvi]MDR0182009.1 peroxiredoxin [Lysobacter arvi]
MGALKAPSTAWLDRYTGHEQAMHTGRVRVTGGEAQHGCASGVVRSADGSLAIDLRLPELLGGEGGGSNPELLPTAVSASCFRGAKTLLAVRAGATLVDAQLDVPVTLSRDPVDGLFLMTARVEVQLPGLDRAFAAELIRNTERIRPHAKMFRPAADHVVTLAAEPLRAGD